MFTGIIEDIGIIKHKTKNTLTLATVLDGVKKGDSIAVNGVCLTAVEILSTRNEYTITMDVMPETLAKTNLKNVNTNDKVNLERALKINDRLNGHIVQGHVEDIGKVFRIIKRDNARIFYINAIPNVLSNCIKKGSIAINGVSLTIVDKCEKYFSVSIIPETFENTIFKFLHIGSLVNLETDFLNKKEEKRVTLELLKEEGYL